MQTNTAVSFLPAITEDKKVDVLLENDEAVLKFSTWSEDLGWCCQKTIRLEAEMLDDLHRAISAARYRLNNRSASGAETSSSKIIEFPSIG